MKISIILPCRNERDAIGECIDDALLMLRTHGIEGEVIVSDSSSDGSADIAARHGAKVIRHGREGYGLAITEGVRASSGDIIAYLDADGTYDFTKIPLLLTALKNADIVLGTRRNGSIASGAMPFLHRWLGTPVLNLLLFLFFGLRISDSQTGFRALRRNTFDALALKTTGMEFATEMLIKARQRGLRIVEIPVPYRRRRGASKLRPYRDGLAHLKYIALQVPLAVYFTPGGVLLALGLLALAIDPAGGAFVSSATVKILFPILGLQTLFLGLFAKTYLAAKFGEPAPFLTHFYARFTLKTAVALGGVLLAVPAAVKLADTPVSFDPLLVSAILGIQIIFNSFTLGTLSIK